MDPIAVPALMVGAPLVLVLLTGHWRKKRTVLAVALASLVLAAVLGVNSGAVSLGARGAGGSWDSLWLLLVWLEFALLIRWAGGFPLRGPLGPLALLGGALVGEVGASLLLCPRTPAPINKARVALTASAGALLSPLGSPVTLLLVEPGHFGFVMPLILALISWPVGWAEDDPHRPLLPLTESGGNGNLWIVAGTLVAVVLGGWDLWALFGGCFLLMLFNIRKRGKPESSWGLQLWVSVVAVLCFFLMSSGALWELKQGLILMIESGEGGLGLWAVLAGAVGSALGTEEGVVLLVDSISEAGLQQIPAAVWTPLAAGIAVGGLTPLICSGALREGLRLWFLQLGVVLLWFTVIH